MTHRSKQALYAAPGSAYHTCGRRASLVEDYLTVTECAAALFSRAVCTGACKVLSAQVPVRC